jgi:hypothetical protein
MRLTFRNLGCILSASHLNSFNSMLGSSQVSLREKNPGIDVHFESGYTIQLNPETKFDMGTGPTLWSIQNAMWRASGWNCVATRRSWRNEKIEKHSSLGNAYSPNESRFEVCRLSRFKHYLRSKSKGRRFVDLINDVAYLTYLIILIQYTLLVQTSRYNSFIFQGKARPSLMAVAT